MPRPSSALSLAALAVAVPLLAACGTSTVNADELEGSVTEQFKAQGIPLTDVSCSDDVEAKAGAKLSCTGRNPAGTVLRIEGSVRSVKDGKAQYHVKAVGGTAPGTAIAAEAKRRLEQQVGQEARGMTCPATVELPTRPSVRCRLQADARTAYGATVTVDAEGAMNVVVDRQPLRAGQQP